MISETFQGTITNSLQIHSFHFEGYTKRKHTNEELSSMFLKLSAYLVKHLRIIIKPRFATTSTNLISKAHDNTMEVIIHSIPRR